MSTEPSERETHDYTTISAGNFKYFTTDPKAFETELSTETILLGEKVDPSSSNKSFLKSLHSVKKLKQSASKSSEAKSRYQQRNDSYVQRLRTTIMVKDGELRQRKTIPFLQIKKCVTVDQVCFLSLD